MPQFKQFKDLSITFDKHPQSRDLLVVKNENAIKMAIKNLIVTMKGERFFNSSFGTSVSNLLFDNMDFGIAGQLQNEISLAIAKYEPRVNLTNVLVLPNFDNNGYDVEVEFEIKGIDIIPTNMEFFLERTR
jgi:phage baseplate assembly protein W